jgi:hypothetical protein
MDLTKSQLAILKLYRAGTYGIEILARARSRRAARARLDRLGAPNLRPNIMLDAYAQGTSAH